MDVARVGDDVTLKCREGADARFVKFEPESRNAVHERFRRERIAMQGLLWHGAPNVRREP